MILYGCRGPRVDNQCLARLELSCTLWLRCGDENLTLLLVGFPQCLEYSLAQLVRLAYALQLKSDCFIRILEVIGKIAAGLVLVLPYDRLQVLINQYMWPTVAGVITKRQISRNELLKPMLGIVCLHIIISKSAR